MRRRNSADGIASQRPLTRSDTARSFGIRSTALISFSVRVAYGMADGTIKARFRAGAITVSFRERVVVADVSSTGTPLNHESPDRMRSQFLGRARPREDGCD